MSPWKTELYLEGNIKVDFKDTYCYLVPNTAVLKYGSLTVQNFELLSSPIFILLFGPSVNGLNELGWDSVGGESAFPTAPAIVQATP